MGALVSGSVSSRSTLLEGVLNIVNKGGAPRIIVVSSEEYDLGKWVKDAVYVLCGDKNDIGTLEEVYCNGTLVATTQNELELLIGVLPGVVF